MSASLRLQSRKNGFSLVARSGQRIFVGAAAFLGFLGGSLPTQQLLAQQPAAPQIVEQPAEVATQQVKVQAQATIQAQASSAPVSVLQSQIDAARQSLDASRLPNVDATRNQLLRQIQAFEHYLGVPANANGQVWLTFLKWDQLKNELNKEQPDLRTLVNVELAFHQNYAGLDYAPFVDTRDALENYIRALRYGAQPDQTIQTLSSQLERLQKVIDPATDMPELERTRDLGLVINYLHESNQAPALVAAVHSLYSYPNIQFTASERFLNRVLARPVQQGTPVDEMILGTHVLGQSCLIGQVTADLVPNYSGVSVCLQLGANFSSNNIGYNRGVKVYTTGYSPIHAAKLISISPQGVSSQPATAAAELQTSINGIEHRLKIVRKIASRQAVKQAPEANAIGEARLEYRLAREFNNQVEQQLAEADTGKLFNQDRPALRRLGIPKPLTTISSTDSHVFAALREAALFQLAAARPARSAPVDSDIVAQLHQSLPSNVADLFLGGRTVNSWEMDDLVRQFTGVVSPELQEESEGEPWSITFADFHPLEVEFEDGLAKISVRATQLTRGDQELNQAATITATYKPVIAEGKVVFERQGDVQLDFAGAPRGIRAVTLRSFLKGKFEKVFKERTDPQGLSLGERVPNLPPLTLASLTLDEGWAQVGLR